MMKAVTSGTKLSEPSFALGRCMNVQLQTSLKLIMLEIRVTYLELQ